MLDLRIVTTDKCLRDLITAKVFPTSSQQVEPWELSSEGKVVVLGIGNPYMHDDAIGPKVVEELKGRKIGENVLVFDYGSLDPALLAYFKGSSKVVIVDALKAGETPGTVSKYMVSESNNPLPRVPSLHQFELYDLVDLAAETGLLPCPIVIIGIEPKDCAPGDGLSDEVKQAIPNVINEVLTELNQAGV